MSHHTVRFRLPMVALRAPGSAMTGCNGGRESEEPVRHFDHTDAFSIEPEEPPPDLIPGEAFRLLVGEAVSEMLDVTIRTATPARSHSDCAWLCSPPERVPFGGPLTSLQVPAMPMLQTGEMMGSQVLDWEREQEPTDLTIAEVGLLEVPRMAYRFGTSPWHAPLIPWVVC